MKLVLPRFLAQKPATSLELYSACKWKIATHLFLSPVCWETLMMGFIPFPVSSYTQIGVWVCDRSILLSTRNTRALGRKIFGTLRENFMRLCINKSWSRGAETLTSRVWVASIWRRCQFFWPICFLSMAPSTNFQFIVNSACRAALNFCILRALLHQQHPSAGRNNDIMAHAWCHEPSYHDAGKSSLRYLEDKQIFRFHLYKIKLVNDYVHFFALLSPLVLD